MAGFVSVGKVNEFDPGVIRGFKLDGADVAVVNTGERFFAFANYCPHMGVELTSGYVYGDSVVCMLHDSAFELATGRLIAGPSFEGIPVYEVRVEGEDVLVGLG